MHNNANNERMGSMRGIWTMLLLLLLLLLLLFSPDIQYLLDKPRDLDL